jgi:hypothetical protein
VTRDNNHIFQKEKNGKREEKRIVVNGGRKIDMSEFKKDDFSKLMILEDPCTEVLV